MNNSWLLLFICMLFSFTSSAQKQGAVWVSGKKGEISFTDSNPIALYRMDNQIISVTSSSICDPSGNLLFYTNGFRVFNGLGAIIENGNSLDLGDYTSWGYGFNTNPDGAILLPMPGDSLRYFLFYTDLNYVTNELGTGLWPTHLFYAIVNKSLGGGLGGIETGEKKIVLLNDTLTQGTLQAIRHANGRDWWLICHEYGSNRYYKFLVTPAGAGGPFIQEIGLTYKTENAGISSPMRFSSDGTLFIHQSRDSNVVELMDFDRCTGEFSNYRTFRIDSIWVPARGVSISPSKQFVYVSSNFNEILQFDITKPDIFSTRKVVGIDNGVENPFPANYYLHELGPDGKIYITPYDESYGLHVINYPDLSDTACGFVEWGFAMLPGTTWFGCAPDVPNYNLGRLEGSTCDTTFTALPPIKDVAFTHSIYPNPCHQQTQFSITGVNGQTPISINNTMGGIIYNTTLQPVNGFIHAFINLQDQPAGVYLLKAKTDRGEVTEKILKE